MSTLFDELPDDGGAVFSACRKYRYSLTRVWDSAKPRVAFCMLNPSTADDVQNDPTIRRCIAFAKSWDFGSLVVLNIFAYRATDPEEMKRAVDPVGPENRATIETTSSATEIKLVICAWGCHGKYLGGGDRIKDLIPPHKRRCLRLTQDGHPQHPLYLPANLTPMEW